MGGGAATKPTELDWQGLIDGLGTFLASPSAGVLVSLGGILAAGAIVVWQVRHQFEHGRKLQEGLARRELRFKIFEEISSLDRQLWAAELEANSFARSVKMNINHQADVAQDGLAFPTTEKCARDFAALGDSVSRANSAMIGLLEKYEIACPELAIFRKAFSVANAEFRDNQSQLFEIYLRMLPTEINTGTNDQPKIETSYRRLPEKAEIKKLNEHTNLFFDTKHNFMSFGFDLNVEAQNLLLGDYFDHRVPRRQPLDPAHIVITADPEDFDRLDRYFDNEANWGKGKKEAESQN